MNNYQKYRGKCKDYAATLCMQNQTLTLVRGYYYDYKWGEQSHWWCKDLNGNIIDPTKYQFPSKGNGKYYEFDGKVECSNCGKIMLEEEASYESNYCFCSAKCHMIFVGLGEYI